MPPYAMIAREPASFCGLNLVGLRRHNFTREQIDNIHEAYRIIYDKSLAMTDRINLLEKSYPDSAEVKYIVEFVKKSTSSTGRGILY